MILPGLSVDSITKYADDVANAYSVMTEDFTIWLFSQRNELPAEYSVIDMARDTAAAIRCLGLEEISLFDVSKGGMVAMTVAIQEPELVSRLILGSTAAKVNTESYQVIDYWVQLAKESKQEELCLAFGEKVYPENVFEQSKDLLIENAKSITEEELERFVILAEGIKGFDVKDQLEKIQCPVLVIGSLDDQVLGSEASEQIAEQLKGRCKLYMYDGYGHAAYDLATDYKERILQFLLQ